MVDVTLAVHINHRRKNKHRAKHHNCRAWCLAYSLKTWRQEFWRRRRAQERHLLVNGRFDELVDRCPPSILWDYW